MEQCFIDLFIKSNAHEIGLIHNGDTVAEALFEILIKENGLVN